MFIFVVVTALFITESAGAVDAPRILNLPGIEIESLDPHLELEGSAIREVFEGLVARDPKTAEPIPAVAKEWKTSADGKRWTFRLREDAKWSNGEAVTASDFVYSWTRLLRPGTAAINAYYTYPIKNARSFNRGISSDAGRLGVRASGPHELIVELESPTPFLLELLDTLPFRPVPRSAIEKFGGRWTRPGNIVSNGPFVLDRWEFGKVISLKPNPAYWDRKNVKLDGVNVLVSPSLQTNENLFRAKQLDLVPQIHHVKLATWKGRPELHSEPAYNLAFLVLNLKRPPLDDKRVRRALALSLDRERLVKYVMQGNETPATAFIPPMGAFRADAHWPLDGKGVAQAKSLLAEAGYGAGKAFPKLSLLLYKNENVKEIAEAIQQQWKKDLGVAVELKLEDKKVFINDLRAKDFDIGYSGWSSDYSDPKVFLELWMKDGGNNDAGFSNGVYERLLARVASENDREKRNELTREAELILADEIPAIPLRFGRRNYLLSPRVRGWYENAAGNHPLKAVSVDQ